MRYYETENVHRDETSEFVSCGDWQPGCIIVRIYGIILFILFVIVGWITSHTCIPFPNCPATDCAI